MIISTFDTNLEFEYYHMWLVVLPHLTDFVFINTEFTQVNFEYLFYFILFIDYLTICKLKTTIKSYWLEFSVPKKPQPDAATLVLNYIFMLFNQPLRHWCLISRIYVLLSIIFFLQIIFLIPAPKSDNIFWYI